MATGWMAWIIGALHRIYHIISVRIQDMFSLSLKSSTDIDMRKDVPNYVSLTYLVWKSPGFGKRQLHFAG